LTAFFCGMTMQVWMALFGAENSIDSDRSDVATHGSFSASIE
jgi:hypothetical protein